MTKKLNLEAIRIDGGTQARCKIDQDRVQLYAAHMGEGEVFPDVVVFFDGTEYWLADGFHRYHATKMNGQVSIACDVRQGSQDDAKLYGMGANAKRGLPPSYEDVVKNVGEILEHPVWGAWTITEIAKRLGESRMRISRIKAKLEKDGKEFSDGPKKFVRGGKEIEINTQALSAKGSPNKKPEPPPPEPEVADDQFKELTETISHLEQENQKLKDAAAVGQWDASEIEKIDAEQLIAELREQIRILEIDNKALRDSRDMFQNRNNELMRTVKSLQAKLKKYE